MAKVEARLQQDTTLDSSSESGRLFSKVIGATFFPNEQNEVTDALEKSLLWITLDRFTPSLTKHPPHRPSFQLFAYFVEELS